MSESERIPDGTVVAERYRVTGVLGAGATGTVYAVEHTRLGRSLAMKVLHPNLAGTPDLTRRFEREAKAIASLDHAHVVGAIDFGEADGVGWYLVTERIDGRALTEALRARPEWTRAAFAQLLDALAHAHLQGILHRDLKPDNVLVAERAGEPFVTILDFGLAKALFDTADVITQHGAVFGTPRYMSPEQAGGEPATAASDQYAVGVMLYEVLEGRPPFDGASVPEILTKHITAEVPTPVSAPKSVGPVIARALSKTPSERYEGAADFAAALDRSLPAEPPDTEVRAAHGASGEARAQGDRRGPASRSAGPSAVAETAAVVEPPPRAPPSWQPRVARGGTALALALAVALGVRALGDDPLDDARAHLDAGRLEAAAAVLDAVQAEAPEHAEAKLLRGHLDVARERWPSAAKAYEAAVGADPDLAADPRFARGVQQILQNRRKRGAQLVKWLAEQGPPEAAGVLAEVAKDGPGLAVRRRAFEGLERLEETDRLEVIAFLTEELGRARSQGCRVRRWYVERLLATGDEAARAAAEAEVRRKDPLFGLVPQSGCMKGLLQPGD